MKNEEDRCCGMNLYESSIKCHVHETELNLKKKRVGKIRMNDNDIVLKKMHDASTYTFSSNETKRDPFFLYQDIYLYKHEAKERR